MKRKSTDNIDNLVKRPHVAYNVDLMQNVVDTEREFLSKLKINYENVFVVSSLLTPMIAKIDISEIARISQCKDFKISGNTLGIELTTYFIPIILDLDHRQCEKNHDCDIQQYTLNNTINNVVDGLSYILKQDKLKVYVERRHCGLHIYVCNLLVSLFVYERILEYLNDTTNFEYFFDDKLTRLPLPMQVKLNKIPYATYVPSDKKIKFIQDKWLMEKPKLLDHHYETTYDTHEGSIELCRFENSNDIIQWNNIIESNVCEERIVTSNGPICSVKQPPSFLSRLTKRKIITKYRLFRDYCNDHREKFASCKEVQLRYPLENVVSEIQVLRTLSRLGILIGGQLLAELYPLLNDDGSESFENIKFIFLLFTPQPEPMFEIFAICAIVEYLHLSIERLSYEELFDQVFVILGAFAPSCDSAMTVIGCLRGHIEMICLEVCGELAPEFILQYITLFLYYKISSKDSIITALNTVFSVEFDDNCRAGTLATKLEHLIFPFFFPCIKTHSSVDDYQFYYFNMRTFLKKTFTPGKKSNSHTTNAEIPLYLITNQLNKTKQPIVQSSFLQYISKIPTVTIKMGKYTYFVNTDQGVFCNLTGTYSRHVPFLHFKDRAQTKKYCLHPSNGMFDNYSCLSYLQNSVQFESVIKYINFFWICDVLLPGLFNASTLNLSHNMLKKILEDLKNRILFQKPDVQKLMNLYRPIIKKFKIPLSVMEECLLKFRPDKLPPSLSNDSPHELYEDFISIDGDGVYKEIYTHAHVVLQNSVNFEMQTFDIIVDENIKLLSFDDIDFVDPLLTETMRYILQLFLYDELTTLEFLKQLALLYQPKNQFRRFLLLFGATGTGKTVLMNLLSDFHGGSVCGILSKLTFNGGSENHSSLALNAATSYLTIVKEASLVDRNILKNLSGNDPIQLRALHQEFQTIEPVSFIVCVANEYPKIIGADNAIRDRLGCFNFPCSFVNELRCENSLERYILSEAVRNELHPELARGLSNLLYLTYFHYTKNNRRLRPQITNPQSINLLNEFMISNNPVYEYLAAAQIVEHPDSEISEKDFKRCIVNAIAHRGTNDNMTYRKFKANFDILFPKAKRDNKILGFRIGSLRTFNSRHMQFVVTQKEQDTITEQNVIDILEADENISDIERNSDLVAFRRQYIFHKRGDSGVFVGIKVK
jgi:hypothetical protein